MIEIRDHPEGVILPIRAQPGSRSNAVRGEHQGALKVCVTQVAERGKANKALFDVLRQALGLRKSQMEWIAGQTSSEKSLLVRGVTRDEIRNRIESLLSGESG